MQLGVHPAALALAGLLSLAVAIGIGRFAYTPILPYMTAGLALGKPEAGPIASANFPGYPLGAMAVSGLTTGAMALTTSLGPFLVLRFLLIPESHPAMRRR